MSAATAVRAKRDPSVRANLKTLPRLIAIPSFIALSLLGATLLLAAPAQAATPTPAWSVSSNTWPTELTPNDSSGDEGFSVYAYNSGGAATDGSTVTLTDELPSGLNFDPDNYASPGCSGTTVVTCTVDRSVPPSEVLEFTLPVTVSPGAPESAVNSVTISGGGAVLASTTQQVGVGPNPAPFGFTEAANGFDVDYAESDGSFPAQAASHPYAFTVGINFTQNVHFGISQGSTHVRDIDFNLPPGMIVNPQATPHCTMAELESIEVERPGCPAASAIGLLTLDLNWSGVGPKTFISPLYNMVPPPGAPSEFAFNAVNLGPLPVTLIGSVRDGDGDYGLSSTSAAILAKLNVVGLYTTLWGDPSDPSHDSMRGECSENGTHGSCPVPVTNTPLLRMPSACSGPLDSTIAADSWEQPGEFVAASSLSHGQGANPLGIEGCNRLAFAPTLEARPTTDVADSPTGLDVDLKVPQEEVADKPATPDLEDAFVKLPEGLVVNPSSADGLQSCSEAQIELKGPEPPACPAASKIGSVEVRTQLVGHPLPGAVYLAAQEANPFHSLLAIYIVIHDPETGVLIKLAGHVEANPETGRLQTSVEENPQLPFEEFKLDFFEGARAPLRTPTTCGAYETSSVLTPYSAPESGPPASPSDRFEISAGPNGSACSPSAAAEPDSPSLQAGTTNLTAGAFAPFVLHLKREDGTQNFKALNVTLPPGLSGRLAGVGECSEAQIAQARSRSHPGEGKLEREDPSCPLASELGIVNVGAGAGPTPIYTQGHAYLAGPYKGAPLSMVIITPAIAGPFDLGTVVVRSGLYVNPETAQITAKSDEIPQILDGIPLDVRSIAVDISRNQFTLNPTNCDPLAIGAEALSALGGAAPLSNRFQVAECQKLAFKPKLALKLKGGTRRAKHPALTATLTMPPGGANIARAQVGLPHSEFLDQAHIKTVCTQPELAAQSCPAASIYGHARAVSPLLEKPLEGPVYLGVGYGTKLPELVAELNGQIRVLLHGRVDTDKQKGIRNTFEVVPDAPVSQFTLSLDGGKRGLLENSEDICRKPQHAIADFTAQNGKVDDFHPLIANSCKKPKKGH